MATLIDALFRIEQLAHDRARNGDGFAHTVYVIARDARETAGPDSQKRVFQGHFISDKALGLMSMEGHKIDAIKQLRADLSIGLKDAKDLWEAYIAQNLSHLIPDHPETM